MYKMSLQVFCTLLCPSIPFDYYYKYGSAFIHLKKNVPFQTKIYLVLYSIWRDMQSFPAPYTQLSTSWLFIGHHEGVIDWFIYISVGKEMT